MAIASTVRAKFQCLEIKNHHVQGGADQVLAEVRLTPVYGGSEENKSWSRYTPSGEIKMSITNPDAIAKFELGKEYYVDFTPVD